MKKAYTKPLIEIEAYELSASIAANCSYKPSFGPGDEEHLTVCEEWSDIFHVGDGMNDTNAAFYENSCDCYYTVSNQGYFTS